MMHKNTKFSLSDDGRAINCAYDQTILDTAPLTTFSLFLSIQQVFIITEFEWIYEIWATAKYYYGLSSRIGLCDWKLKCFSYCT